MKCAYDGAYGDTVKPFWIRSVGIPLCERHASLVRSARETCTEADRPSLELLAAAAVAVLSAELDARTALVA